MKEISRENLFILWIKLVIKFFISEKRKVAIIGIVGLIIFELLKVYIAVRITEWSGEFYDSLQNLNYQEFKKQMLIFVVLAASFVLISLLRQSSRLWYLLEWRIWQKIIS